MKTEPQKEHQWLQKLVGKWTCEAAAMMESDRPPAKCKGSDGSTTARWTRPEGC